ncbi:type II toxin-antitoxin system RelE/ParE family toxin [Mitsuaria sp. 7]|uniref:type II toxin-antitoxin system RelE/ParE family toxin n=1 Tax=Mitsuaria sp. 7 TaxID=1658665 RepID=UPI001E472C4A
MAEMERGLIDANLGSGLFKKRIGRSGAGKRAGYRVIVASRPGGPWFFIEGYAKNKRETVDAETMDACRELASALTRKSARELSDSVERNNLKELKCDA